jgi:hypothetical protein
MSEQEKNQGILQLLAQVLIDALDFEKQLEFPDSYYAIINFAGRGMKSILESEEKQKFHQLKRKPTFSVDDMSRLVTFLVLHSMQIGRIVNDIREEEGRQRIDWYERAVEEDSNEKK